MDVIVSKMSQDVSQEVLLHPCGIFDKLKFDREYQT